MIVSIQIIISAIFLNDFLIIQEEIEIQLTTIIFF